MSHVFARLAGYGLVVLPFPDFRIERVDGAPETRLVIGRGERSADVDVAAVVRGEVRTDLADVVPGPRNGPFRIETRVWSCLWPPGFTLVPDASGASPFLLLGRSESMIWVDGPLPRARAWPPEEQLVGPGQRVRAIADAEDATYLDLDYVVGDVPWWQRRYVLAWGADRVCIVTAQAPAHVEDEVLPAVTVVADGLAPYRPD